MTEATKRWEKILEKEPKNLEKYGTFIMFHAIQSLGLMKEHIKFLKDLSKIKKDAINAIKSDKVFIEFLLSLIKAKKDKNKEQIIQKAAQTEEDFRKFVISSIKEIDLRTEIEEDEIYKIKQYEDAIKYKLITIFRNTKHLSQETIESIEKLKQELIKDAGELDVSNTLKNAIGHAIKLKVEIKNHIEFLNQEIEEKQKLLNTTNKETEENKTSKNDNTSFQEISERLKESSKKGADRMDALYRPIEMASLYRITHKEEKLKDLNKYITYNWIHNVKAYEIMREKLMRKYSELIERESIRLEKKRKKK
jgi:hypothetical protein